MGSSERCRARCVGRGRRQVRVCLDMYLAVSWTLKACGQSMMVRLVRIGEMGVCSGVMSKLGKEVVLFGEGGEVSGDRRLPKEDEAQPRTKTAFVLHARLIVSQCYHP